jgi:TPR repeat protein
MDKKRLDMYTYHPRFTLQARAWMTKAAEQGDATSQYNLFGTICQLDAEEADEALLWLEKAAAQGFPDAVALANQIKINKEAAEKKQLPISPGANGMGFLMEATGTSSANTLTCAACGVKQKVTNTSSHCTAWPTHMQPHSTERR